jgi:hypothetical protein
LRGKKQKKQSQATINVDKPFGFSFWLWWLCLLGGWSNPRADADCVGDGWFSAISASFAPGNRPIRDRLTATSGNSVSMTGAGECALTLELCGSARERHAEPQRPRRSGQSILPYFSARSSPPARHDSLRFMLRAPSPSTRRSNWPKVTPPTAKIDAAWPTLAEPIKAAIMAECAVLFGALAIITVSIIALVAGLTR